MHRLQQELYENDELLGVVQGLSERVAGNEGKMGLLLDLNPMWRLTARFAAAGLDSAGWWYEWPFRPLASTIPAELLGPEAAGTLDFGYRSNFVEDAINVIGDRKRDAAFQPLLLRLVAYSESTREERQGLLAAARETEILTVVNTHPVPRLIAGPGSELTSVSTRRSGTLGGYLSDKGRREHFAVTCGHVATWGDFTSSGTMIGAVTEARDPTPLPTGMRCHAACGSVTELDVALIDVGSPGTNVARSVAGIVCNGDLVTMNGSSSGTRMYEVGALVVDHEIGGACWKNLIQLHAQRAGVLPMSVHVAIATLPQDGDSGAWVLNGTEWVGMVVASDKNLCGYAIPGDSLIDKANACFGRSLELS